MFIYAKYLTMRFFQIYNFISKYIIIMTFTCNICSHVFIKKQSLITHLTEKRCKSPLLDNIYELHKYIGSLKASKCYDVNYINNKRINPITKLDISYIDSEKMMVLIDRYDTNSDKLNLILSEYIKNILYDKEHPENHAVKYIKKKPPTYNCIIEESDGNIINISKGLKDTCELLSEHILKLIRTKLREFIKKYKKEVDFDYSLYEDSIENLKKIDLNKKNVKKALSSLLQNVILHDNIMKSYKV